MSQTYPEIVRQLRDEYFIVKKGQFWAFVAGFLAIVGLAGVGIFMKAKEAGEKAALEVIHSEAAAKATQEILRLKVEAQASHLAIKEAENSVLGKRAIDKFAGSYDVFSDGTVKVKDMLTIRPVTDDLCYAYTTGGQVALFRLNIGNHNLIELVQNTSQWTTTAIPTIEFVNGDLISPNKTVFKKIRQLALTTAPVKE